ncbi:thionin-like protein 2 [Capsella rubella]|uniref:thionin-like protein 2 n=1 Tax=Capsella rubella TaxID=81985 RepID=UPI000CD4DB01|nr:thionin-like protein 2 [Capsella rubella]
MESKIILVVMILFTIGNLMVKSEGLSKYVSPNSALCYPGCLEVCITGPYSQNKSSCSTKCAEHCWKPNPDNYYCKVDCLTHSCVSVKDHNGTMRDAKRTMICVDSCLDMCDKKKYRRY